MRFPVSLLAALLALPATASAEIILKNRDRRPHQLLVRDPVSTKTTSVPAGSYLILSEDAHTIQLRDGSGNPKGAALEVANGDRVEVLGGKLVKKPADVASSE